MMGIVWSAWAGKWVLSSVVLAPFASAHYARGVSHGGWPVEALLERVSNEGSWRIVVSTCPAMDILQQPPPLFGRDAVL
jgi:hypothetical protein